MVDLKSPGENIRQYKVGPSSSVCWLKLFTTWPWARVLPVGRLCQRNLGSLSQHHGQSSFRTLVSLFSDSTRVASRVSGGICGWIRVIGRCSVAISRSLFPLAMTHGVDGFRAEIQLTWDEFSRMRNGLIDGLHFLRFTLIGTGLLPLPAANCQSWLRSVAHIFSNWHLQSWSCFPVSLHHLLVVRCGLSAAFNGKGRKVAFWDAAGCFGGRAAERKPWLVRGNFSKPKGIRGVKMCL